MAEVLLREMNPTRYKRHLFAIIADSVAKEVARLYFSNYRHAASAIAMGRSIAQRDLNIAVNTKNFNGGRPMLLDRECVLEIELWDEGEVLVEMKWNGSETAYDAMYKIESVE